MAYSAVNPLTDDTAVMLPSLELHVFAIAAMVGAAGKITTLTVLLDPHTPEPAVPALEDPQAADNT